MKRIVSILLLAALWVLPVSCGSPLASEGDTAERENETHTQEDTGSAALSEGAVLARLSAMKEGERAALPETELDGAVLEERRSVTSDALGSPGSVLFFREDLPELYSQRACYLVLTSAESWFLQRLPDWCFEWELTPCDLDGDGSDEIVIHRLLDHFGGAGQHSSRVFRITAEGLREIFCSEEGDGRFDTGFSAEALEGRRLKIVNRHTGKESLLSLGDYPDDGFDEEGRLLPEEQMECDGFYAFTPTDVDGDGVYEIEALQFVFLGWHANGIGDGKVVLRYDVQTGGFAVVDSDFLAYEA